MADKLKKFEMVKSVKGGFEVKLTPKHHKMIAKKPSFIALATDFSGHYCIYRGIKRKVTEQKERYATPEEAIVALK